MEVFLNGSGKKKRGKEGKEKEEKRENERKRKEGTKEGREKEWEKEGEEKLSWSLQMASLLRNSFHVELAHLQLKLSVNFEFVLSLKISYSESLVYSQVFPKHVSCPGHVWQTMPSFSKESLSLDFPLRLSAYLLFASSAIFLLQGAVDQSLAFQWFWEMPNA